MAASLLSSIVLSLCLLGASAGTYDGFRAKFGWSDTLENKEYFFNLPRTVSQAVAGGWRLVKRPLGVALPELVMYCRPDDVNVCPLYAASGFVAGLQVAIPNEATLSIPQDPAKKFIKWKDVVIGETKTDYWTTSLYFVSEAALKRGAGPRIEDTNTIQDVNIWAQDPMATTSDKLVQIPIKETDLQKTLFTKENCIPNMGTHYFYNMTPKLTCKDLLPWFLLVKEGRVIGAGFQTVGRTHKIGARDWFETPPSITTKIIVPTAPACLSQWAQDYGVISLHVYFVDQPWNIKCEDGDSVQPMSVVNQLILTASRYAHIVIDEAKKIFSG